MEVQQSSMKQKNRFSNLLEHLMEVADIKNYMLAKELQYDVSYISKWVSGQMLPSSKTETSVLQGISRCIVKDGTEEGRQTLLEDYRVPNYEDLQTAIYDNLMAEYNYVKDTQKETGNTIAPKTSYYPKLNMPQFIVKMQHPVLRRVKSLEIMALIDLMAIEREYRLQIISMENGFLSEELNYPDVHYSMVLDLNSMQGDYVYDVVFLLNMLTNLTHIDFHLYGSSQAHGRIIFCIKDDFSITGMLMESNLCLSVTASEEQENCDILYRYIHSMCSRERLLFLPGTMTEMLLKQDYTRSVLASNQQLIVGHMTEHSLTIELFEEICTQLIKEEKYAGPITIENLRWFHALTQHSYMEMPIKIIFIGAALSEFAVTGELDFYNMKIKLTPKQRLQYMQELSERIKKNNMSCKMINGSLTADFLYFSNQWIFLSDNTSYMRLESGQHTNRLYIVNHMDMKNIFYGFFDELWNNNEEKVISDKETILQYIEHIIGQIRMITLLDGQNTESNEEKKN